MWKCHTGNILNSMDDNFVGRVKSGPMVSKFAVESLKFSSDDGLLMASDLRYW